MRTLTRRDAPGDPLAARIERAELQFATRRRCAARSTGSTRSSTPTGSASRTARRRSSAPSRTRACSSRAASAAGARRVVHVSVTNPSLAVAAAVLPRQGGGRARRRRVGPLARDRAADARLRAAGHPREQHRVGSPPQPGLPDRRRRELPRAAGLGRGHGDDLRRRRGAETRTSCSTPPGPRRSPTTSSCGSSPRPSARRARIVHWPARVVLALARAAGAVRRDVLLTRRGARRPAGEPARLRPAAARARELQLLGRRERRDARARLRLGAGAQLPSVRSALMARSELTIDLGASGATRARSCARSRAPSCGRWSRPTATGTAPWTSAARRSGAGATALCVATVPEGLALRHGLGSVRVIVLGPATSREIAEARDAGLELVIADGEVPEGVRVHLKLDTGMGRWGLSELRGARSRGGRADEPPRLGGLRHRVHRAAGRAVQSGDRALSAPDAAPREQRRRARAIRPRASTRRAAASRSTGSRPSAPTRPRTGSSRRSAGTPSSPR